MILTSDLEAGGIASHRRKLPLPEPLRRRPPLREAAPLPHSRNLDPVLLAQSPVRISVSRPQEQHVTSPELDALLLGDGLDALVGDAVRAKMVDAHAVPGGVRGVVDQDAAAGEALCGPGFQAVDLRPQRGVDIRLCCPLRLSALRRVVFGTAAMSLGAVGQEGPLTRCKTSCPSGRQSGGSCPTGNYPAC